MKRMKKTDDQSTWKVADGPSENKTKLTEAIESTVA